MRAMYHELEILMQAANRRRRDFIVTGVGRPLPRPDNRFLFMFGQSGTIYARLCDEAFHAGVDDVLGYAEAELDRMFLETLARNG